MKIKVGVLGDNLVGKTTFLSSYIDELKSPTKLDYACFHQCSYDRQNELEIIDTSGDFEQRDQIRFHLLKIKPNILLFFFDLTNQISFEEAVKQIQFWSLNTDQIGQKILLGTKVDLVDKFPSRRKVSTTEAIEFSEKLKCLYWEICCLDKETVRGIMQNSIEKELLNLECENPESVDVTVEKGKSQQKCDCQIF